MSVAAVFRLSGAMAGRVRTKKKKKKRVPPLLFQGGEKIGVLHRRDNGADLAVGVVVAEVLFDG